jgi:subtilisin-like proprotein convertase family protein
LELLTISTRRLVARSTELLRLDQQLPLMKKFVCLVSAVYLLTGDTKAVTTTFATSGLSATIPDGNLNGYQSSFTVSGMPNIVTDINFTWNVSGAFNGDLYAYISHGGANAILLNRPGRSSTSNVGYSDTGFATTFDDQAASDVHFYRAGFFALNPNGQLTGSWQPDGRGIDPLSAGSAFAGANRANNMGVFNGMDPNGTWTLFIADTSPGVEGTLNSYGLQVTSVPEPASATLTLLSLGVFILRQKVRVAPPS